jgi:hypothetical protein
MGKVYAGEFFRRQNKKATKQKFCCKSIMNFLTDGGVL